MHCKCGTCAGEVTRGLKLAFHVAEVPCPCNQQWRRATRMDSCARVSQHIERRRATYYAHHAQPSWWQQDYWRLLQPRLWVTQSGTAHHAGTEQLIRHSCAHTSAGAASARSSGGTPACQTPGRQQEKDSSFPSSQDYMSIIRDAAGDCLHSRHIYINKARLKLLCKMSHLGRVSRKGCLLTRQLSSKEAHI